MRTRTTRFIVNVGVMLLLAAGSASAHHSMIVEFNVDKPITLRGTITKVEWTNPHGWIYIDVKHADGEVVNWAIETGSPTRMAKRGLKQTDLQPGLDVIIGGFPAKNGKLNMAGWIVAFPGRATSSPDREATFALGR